MRQLFVIGLVVALIFVVPTTTSAQADVLGTCLVDSLNGKERKQLARWIFFAIAAHPEINPFLRASGEDIDSNNKIVGKLVTRLFVNDCPAQLHAANERDARAVEKAFEFVGQVAMQELMANEAVANSIAGYATYVDQAKISAVLEGE